MAAPLKDVYDRAYVERLAAACRDVRPAFPAREFVERVLDESWPTRELKARMRHLTTCLGESLPGTYRDQLAAIVAIAPAFGSFHGMFCPDFVEVFGLGDWEASIPALRELTRHGSSEFAVRPFLLADPARMLTTMRVWAEDPNEHVRRLASEGCRPRLPWAPALPAFQKDPRPLLPILERLRADPSEYVRRSVANNLNDIARTHPELVLDLTASWLGESSPTDRLLKHACRGLLRRGEVRALRLFGFPEPTGLRLEGLTLSTPELAIGEDLQLQFDLVLEAEEPLRLRLELAVDYAAARGPPRRKIYQLGERTLPPGRHPRTCRRSFADRSTRRHRPGTHGVAVLANGVELASAAFEVVAAG